MKKKLCFLFLLLLLPLTGCISNDTVSHDGEIKLALSNDYAQYLTYYEEIPTFTLTFDGQINTIANLPRPEYVIFASNDDIKLSSILKDLFTTYENSAVFVVESIKSARTSKLNYDDESGKRVTKKFAVDNNEVYYETAYIALENGLKLTLDYRHFISEGVDYYAWRETSNISMNLYYPVMVIQEGTTREMLLLTLPNMIKYQVGTTLQASKVIKDNEYVDTDKFTNESQMCGKYTLGYYEGEMSKEEQQQYVKDYYINNHNGYYETITVTRDGIEVAKEFLFFSYLDVLFSVEFFPSQFTIRFEEKLR